MGGGLCGGERVLPFVPAVVAPTEPRQRHQRAAGLVVETGAPVVGGVGAFVGIDGVNLGVIGAGLEDDKGQRVAGDANVGGIWETSWITGVAQGA